MNILETERLIIRPFKMGDLEDAHQLLDVDLQWEGPSFSIDQRRERLEFYIYLAGWKDTGCIYGYRAIILKENELLIGICGFLPSLWSSHTQDLFGPEIFGKSGNTPKETYASSELEIGYALSSVFQGKGYATEAVKAIVDYAFVELKVERIFAGTNRSNKGSMNLMKRIGMRVSGNPEHPEMDWPNGPGVAGVIEN